MRVRFYQSENASSAILDFYCKILGKIKLVFVIEIKDLLGSFRAVKYAEVVQQEHL